MYHSRSRLGFTLIELMIVVVIIGILAAIAIPRFTKRGDSTPAANVDAALQQGARQQEAHRGQQNSYASSTAALAGAGWDTTAAAGSHTYRVVSGTAEAYCIEAAPRVQTTGPQEVRHIDQTGTVKSGPCQ